MKCCTAPLIFRIVPRSVLKINNPPGENQTNRDTEISEEPVHHQGEFVEDTKYERSPRIQPDDVLGGPIFDKSLIVDVRSEKAFEEEHVLGSVLTFVC